MYRVKEMREELGWTQEKLSEASGVSRTIISALETSDTTRTYTGTLIKLAAAMNCTVADIFVA